MKSVPRDQNYRSFIAIELPAHVRARIAKHINQLQRNCPEARASWTREENLHLTLKFLGNVPVAEIPKLSQAAADSAQAVSPFRFVIGGCGTFPQHGQPKVLWIGVTDASNQLQRLHQEVEKNCQQIGFSPETRTFHPHLTIARLRSANRARELAQLHQTADFAPVSVEVQELLLMRSELSSHGSRYTALARHQCSNVQR